MVCKIKMVPAAFRNVERPILSMICKVKMFLAGGASRLEVRVPTGGPRKTLHVPFSAENNHRLCLWKPPPFRKVDKHILTITREVKTVSAVGASRPEVPLF